MMIFPHTPFLSPGNLKDSLWSLFGPGWSGWMSFFVFLICLLLSISCMVFSPGGPGGPGEFYPTTYARACRSLFYF